MSKAIRSSSPAVRRALHRRLAIGALAGKMPVEQICALYRLKPQWRQAPVRGRRS